MHRPFVFLLFTTQSEAKNLSPSGSILKKVVRPVEGIDFMERYSGRCMLRPYSYGGL